MFRYSRVVRERSRRRGLMFFTFSDPPITVVPEHRPKVSFPYLEKVSFLPPFIHPSIHPHNQAPSSPQPLSLSLFALLLLSFSFHHRYRPPPHRHDTTRVCLKPYESSTAVGGGIPLIGWVDAYANEPTRLNISIQ